MSSRGVKGEAPPSASYRQDADKCDMLKIMKFEKIGVLVNTNSGCFASGEINTEDVKAEFDKYSEYFSNIRFFPTASETLTAQLKQLKEFNPDLAVAAGGDGTVGALIDSFPAEKIPIAIIPCGTFNHFASDAGVPLEMKASVAAAFSGSLEKLDAASVNGRLFINNSSIGLYPHSVEVRENLEKKYGHNRWLFLILAFSRIFTRFPVYKVTLKINGREEKHITSSLFVGNNKYEVELLKFGSRESLKDGKLSLYFSKCRNRWKFLRNAFFLVLGRLEQAENFELLLVDDVYIQTQKRKVRVSADGELIRLSPPLRYESLPGAVKIILLKQEHG